MFGRENKCMAGKGGRSYNVKKRFIVTEPQVLIDGEHQTKVLIFLSG